MVKFALEKRPDANGQTVDTLVKYAGEVPEEWCTVPDLDRLFDTCVRRWPEGWDLEKLLESVRTSQVD